MPHIILARFDSSLETSQSSLEDNFLDNRQRLLIMISKEIFKNQTFEFLKLPLCSIFSESKQDIKKFIVSKSRRLNPTLPQLKGWGCNIRFLRNLREALYGEWEWVKKKQTFFKSFLDSSVHPHSVKHRERILHYI